LLPLQEAGCQGFSGPLPSAFLDKQIKNYPKDRPAGQILKIIFHGEGEQAAPYIVIIFIDSIYYD
jgi:hypothetical protein